MKSRFSKTADILIESINYIIINYALSNMEMLFRTNILFVLFFSSEIWVTVNYFRKVYEVTKKKWVTVLLTIVCFVIDIGMVYFVGRIVGEIIPFHS